MIKSSKLSGLPLSPHRQERERGRRRRSLPSFQYAKSTKDGILRRSKSSRAVSSFLQLPPFLPSPQAERERKGERKKESKSTAHLGVTASSRASCGWLGKKRTNLLDYSSNHLQASKQGRARGPQSRAASGDTRGIFVASCGLRRPVELLSPSHRLLLLLRPYIHSIIHSFSGACFLLLLANAPFP